MHRPHHHYPVLAFNALATVWGFGYPRAICRALGHSITVRAWTIKGRTDDKSRQTLLGEFNPRLKQRTQQFNNPLRGCRELRSGVPKHVNHCVHPA
jgi:hypothetical protein